MEPVRTDRQDESQVFSWDIKMCVSFWNSFNKWCEKHQLDLLNANESGSQVVSYLAVAYFNDVQMSSSHIQKLWIGRKT